MTNNLNLPKPTKSTKSSPSLLGLATFFLASTLYLGLLATGNAQTVNYTSSDPQRDESASLLGSAAKSVAQSMGLQFRALPVMGCSESVLSPEKLNELLASLDEPARSSLYSLLEMSESAWRAQIYSGEDGAGLCLPMQDALILIEGFAGSDPSSKSWSERIGQNIKSLGASISNSLRK